MNQLKANDGILGFLMRVERETRASFDEFREAIVTNELDPSLITAYENHYDDLTQSLARFQNFIREEERKLSLERHTERIS